MFPHIYPSPLPYWRVNAYAGEYPKGEVIEEKGLREAGKGPMGGKPQVPGKLVGEKPDPGREEAPAKPPFQIAEDLQGLPHPFAVQVEPALQDLEAVAGPDAKEGKAGKGGSRPRDSNRAGRIPRVRAPW